MSTIQNQKVTLTEKIGYGLGDCSANLVFQMMMIYQTKFYTDIFGLEGAIAGTVMLVARIVDAFVDPTVGLLWYSTYWHSIIRVLRTKGL